MDFTKPIKANIINTNCILLLLWEYLHDTGSATAEHDMPGTARDFFFLLFGKNAMIKNIRFGGFSVVQIQNDLLWLVTLCVTDDLAFEAL